MGFELVVPLADEAGALGVVIPTFNIEANLVPEVPRVMNNMCKEKDNHVPSLMWDPVLVE